jgi:hypothetical protein
VVDLTFEKLRFNFENVVFSLLHGRNLVPSIVSVTRKKVQLRIFTSLFVIKLKTYWKCTTDF